jgi:carboxyl-terminal processing protease
MTRSACAIGIVAGALGAGALAPVATAQRQPFEHLQTLNQVIGQVRTSYVDTVGYGDLVRKAIDGMLRGLDPYSRYVSADEWSQWWSVQHGRYAGVGIAVERVDGVITIIGVLPRGTAGREGVLPGDRVIAVEDSVVTTNDPMDVERRLGGPEGSRIRLRLERGPRTRPDTIVLSLKRESLDPPAVWHQTMADSMTGYVQFVYFAPDAAAQVEAAVRSVRRSGARQLILDLRGNPGGGVAALVQTASLFLPESTLVYQVVGRTPASRSKEFTRLKPRFPEIPLILLLDGYSASASETFAGALQDHDRALVLGQRSFGKGLVQTPFPLANNDVVWLTTGRISTPAGRVIQRPASADSSDAPPHRSDNGRELRGGYGIAPDVELPTFPLYPGWVTGAVPSGILFAVVDSVAGSLPGNDVARKEWIADDAAWKRTVYAALMERVRRETGDAPEADADAVQAIAFSLAVRVAEARWGPGAAAELVVRHDPSIRAAVAQFPDLPARLAAPR